VPVILAFVAVGILSLLGVFHLALAFSAPFGRFAWGGYDDVLPSGLRLRSGVAVLLFIAAIFVELQAGNILTTIDIQIGIASAIVLILIFFAGFVLSAFSQSVWEKGLMTPVCIALAALTLIVLVTGHLPPLKPIP
jgi:hypothetical protein